MRRFLAALLCVSPLAGCTCVGSELKMRMQPEEKDVSDVARSEKAAWREAVVRRVVRKVNASGRDPFNYWTVVDSVVFRDGPRDQPYWVRLAGTNEQATSMEKVQRHMSARYELAYGASGKTLAVRELGASEWTILWVAEYPVACSKKGPDRTELEKPCAEERSPG